MHILPTKAVVLCRCTSYSTLIHPIWSINGVVVIWVVAIDPPGVRFPLNACGSGWFLHSSGTDDWSRHAF